MEILLGLAALFVAIAAQRRGKELLNRIQTLERTVAQLGQRGLPGASLEGPAQTAPTPPPPPSVAPPLTPPPPFVPSPEPAPSRPRSIPPSPPRPAPRPTKSFEESFGTRWVVWVGGLALALGGIFLVQVSIEAGLLGPGPRIVLGLLLAAALLAAGEWARRNDSRLGLANMPVASIPAILTGAGIVVAFGVVYAAYALYGFLDAGAAFVVLGLVAVGGLVAALLHGPVLAGLGLAGSYMTPLMVASDTPNYWALYIYIAAVTAANFALASARRWRWLAVTALVFSVLWSFVGIVDPTVDSLTPHAFQIVTGFALAAAFLVSNLLWGPPGKGHIDAISSASLAAFCAVAAIFFFARGHDQTAFAIFMLLAFANIAVAMRSEAAVGAVAASAILVPLVAINWAGAIATAELGDVLAGAALGISSWRAEAVASQHLAVGSIIAACIALAGFQAQGRSSRALEAMIWAAAGAFAPLAMLVGAYLQQAGGQRSVPLALVALILAGLGAYATEALSRRPRRPGASSAAAIFAAGSVAALALGVTFTLDGGDLNVGLALMVPGIAYVAARRPLPALRWLAAGVALLVTLRFGAQPGLLDRAGPTPIFNWLLYGYGVPALAFWAGGLLLRQRADDAPARSVEAAAILFTALFAFFEIRHAVHGSGRLLVARSGLVEIALHVSTALAMAIGLEWLRRRSRSVVHNIAAVAMAVLGLVGAAFGLVLWENPVFRGGDVGGPVVNLLLLAYALPGILLGLLAKKVQATRPRAYGTVAGLSGIGLLLLYLTLEVRRHFQGPDISWGPILLAEQYTYSAVWLVFGVALLMAGIAMRSQSLRLASAVVVLGTVAKVFLVDLSRLTGIYRALSFIGLGLVLVAIGALYQRLLFPRRPVAPER